MKMGTFVCYQAELNRFEMSLAGQASIIGRSISPQDRKKKSVERTRSIWLASEANKGLANHPVLLFYLLLAAL